MASEEAVARERRPALLCYDGSDSAKSAIEHAAALLDGGPAIVLTVWESIGALLLRHPFPGATELGRDVRMASEEVVNELDADTAERAAATAAEGAELATTGGFEARSLAHRALGRYAERAAVTVWQAVLETAEREDAALLVLGSRGQSGVTSALLGSVSYGVVHHATRPVLVVPPAA